MSLARSSHVRRNMGSKRPEKRAVIGLLSKRYASHPLLDRWFAKMRFVEKKAAASYPINRLTDASRRHTPRSRSLPPDEELVRKRPLSVGSNDEAPGG